MSQPDPSRVLDGNLLHMWNQLTFEAGMRGADPPAGYGWQQGLAPALPDGSYVVMPQYLFSPTAGDDAVWINNAITQAKALTGTPLGTTAQGARVLLAPMVYNLVSGPVIIDKSNVALWGANFGNGTQLVNQFTAAQTAMMIIGNTVIVAQPDVRRMRLLGTGSFNSGHGVILRAEVGLLEDVQAESVSGDCLHISPSDLVGTNIDTLQIRNFYGLGPAGCGVFCDDQTTSSEFWSCHFAGSVTANTRGGTYGIHNQGKAVKFFGCHPFGFSTANAYFDGCNGGLLEAGEYESGTINVLLANGATRSMIKGINTYNGFGTAPTTDISVASSPGNLFTGNQLNAAAATNDSIAESGTSDYNLIDDNICSGLIVTTGAHTVAPAATNITAHPL